MYIYENPIKLSITEQFFLNFLNRETKEIEL